MSVRAKLYLTLLLSSLCIAPASAAVVGGIAVVDPSGDAGTGSDLIGINVQVDDLGTFIFQARFAPGTYDGNTFVGFSLDLDENPATGLIYFDQGVDYALWVSSSNWGSTAELQDFSILATIQTYAITAFADGFDVIVPWADLNYDGAFSVRASVQTQLSAASYSSVYDFAPDAGLSSAALASDVVAAPEPATWVSTTLGLAILLWRRRGA